MDKQTRDMLPTGAPDVIARLLMVVGFGAMIAALTVAVLLCMGVISA